MPTTKGPILRALRRANALWPAGASLQCQRFTHIESTQCVCLALLRKPNACSCGEGWNCCAKISPPYLMAKISPRNSWRNPPHMYLGPFCIICIAVAHRPSFRCRQHAANGAVLQRVTDTYHSLTQNGSGAGKTHNNTVCMDQGPLARRWLPTCKWPRDGNGNRHRQRHAGSRRDRVGRNRKDRDKERERRTGRGRKHPRDPPPDPRAKAWDMPGGLFSRAL